MKGTYGNYTFKKQPQSDPLPVATVLTIPAAGSESSPNTVITNEETRRKLGYGSPKLRPVFSIINPELFFTLPAPPDGQRRQRHDEPHF